MNILISRNNIVFSGNLWHIDLSFNPFFLPGITFSIGDCTTYIKNPPKKHFPFFIRFGFYLRYGGIYLIRWNENGDRFLFKENRNDKEIILWNFPYKK